MIRGTANEDLEAWFSLHVSIAASSIAASFLLDTGFSGYLSITREIAETLELPLEQVQPGITADGTATDIYVVTSEFCGTDVGSQFRHEFSASR